MQMHSGGGDRVRGSRKELPAAEAAAPIRKGPWMAEEDAVLIDYVKRYGPRDWSSIRSKGLLPRTGKSCRLRWVNKLKPDLKTGCKFSAEEERLVIDLQARFGNKWARIATHLPGRTDNDVKNFWSTRQKRLARLLQTPLLVRSHRNQGKVSMPFEMPIFEPNANSGVLPYNDPQCLDLIPFPENCPNNKYIHAPYVEDADAMKMVLMPNLDAALPLLDPAITDHELFLQSSSSPPQSPFDQSLLDLPLLSEGQDLILEFGEMSFPGQFGCAESCQVLMPHPLASSAFFDLEDGGHGIKMEHPGTPESFFSDFPSDMFECLDQPPVL